MDSTKFTQTADVKDPVEIERIRAESERAIQAVDSFKYAAMRQYHYAIWPTAGEISAELIKLKAMPAFERAELFHRAGLSME